ncbi:hypothetical protein COY95_01060, partial [Candidatus Woesearchaeota archaeon CG_4_10_14_0_8_um_filter_47_5]
MNILVCPDSYKGTLSAKEASCAIEAGILRVCPSCTITRLPMADGGHGTLEVIRENTSCRAITKQVRGPLGSPVTAEYLIFQERIFHERIQQIPSLQKILQESLVQSKHSHKSFSHHESPTNISSPKKSLPPDSLSPPKISSTTCIAFIEMAQAAG